MSDKDEEEGFYVAGEVLPSTKDADTLGREIFVSKEAAQLALKNGLKQQRGEYISRLKQIRVAFEKQRRDTSEETLQLQQTLKMLRDEFQTSEETLSRTKKERDDARSQASTFKEETESLREIMAAMGNEIKIMRNRILELNIEDDDNDGKKMIVSRPPAVSLDVSCKTTTVHISRQGSVGIVNNDDKKENLEQDKEKKKSSPTTTKDDDEEEDSSSSTTTQHKPTPTAEHKPSLIGSALMGLGSLWGSSNSIVEDKSSAEPTTPKRRSRRRSVSDPQLSPRPKNVEPPMTPEKSNMKVKIDNLQRQLNAMREEQIDLDINHRCEVKSLKDIVKAMSSEIDNLRSEKKLLMEEKNRLLEELAQSSGK